MKTKLVIAALAIIAIPLSSVHAQDGAQLFRTNCGACHTVGKGKLVGPDLKDVQDRHTEQWIFKWVHSSQTLVKAGDKDAVKLFNDNSQIPMPDQALSDNDVKTILAFIKTEGTPAPVASTTPGNSNITPSNSTGTDNITLATQKVAAEEKNNPSFIESLTFTNYMVFFLIGILLIVIWILTSSIKSLTEYIKYKK